VSEWIRQAVADGLAAHGEPQGGPSAIARSAWLANSAAALNGAAAEPEAGRRELVEVLRAGRYPYYPPRGRSQPPDERRWRPRCRPRGRPGSGSWPP
jgi:hypothetical protein